MAAAQGAHLGGCHPVIGGAGVFLLFRADKGAVFHPGHVARILAGQKAVRAFGFVEFDEGA